MTITEGLQEIKTLVKRIEKKRTFINSYLYRQNNVRDPHESDGGSQHVLDKERQAIKDLENNIIDIRERISDANKKTHIVLSGISRSISEWIIWRREIVIPRKKFLEEIFNKIQHARRQATQQGLNTVNSEKQAGALDLIVNINEKELAFEIEKTEDILSTLDGKLSLKNGTVSI